MNALGTMALTEKQQGNVHVCGKNLGRIIVGVKRANKRKYIKIMTAEVGVKERSKKKLVRSTWVSHIVKW